MDAVSEASGFLLASLDPCEAADFSYEVKVQTPFGGKHFDVRKVKINKKNN